MWTCFLSKSHNIPCSPSSKLHTILQVVNKVTKWFCLVIVYKSFVHYSMCPEISIYYLVMNGFSRTVTDSTPQPRWYVRVLTHRCHTREGERDAEEGRQECEKVHLSCVGSTLMGHRSTKARGDTYTGSNPKKVFRISSSKLSHLNEISTAY